MYMSPAATAACLLGTASFAWDHFGDSGVLSLESMYMLRFKSLKPSFFSNKSQQWSLHKFLYYLGCEGHFQCVPRGGAGIHVRVCGGCGVHLCMVI